MSKAMEATLTASRWACYLLLMVLASIANAGEWPQELSVDEGKIIVYQPQPDKLEGRQLSGRAAMSIELKSGGDPIFGVFWFSAAIETDRSDDSASISHFKVTRVNWPDSKDPGEQRFTQVVEKALAGSVFETSLSRLTSALAIAEKTQQSLEELNNEPPQILFSEQLAILLLFDGKPKFSPIENSHYERALNTPLAVVSDTDRQQFYLTSGSLWYEAQEALGPWTATTNPPADLVAMIPKSDDPVPLKIPAIVSATEPTELIVSDGSPAWKSLEGGKLLYVQNTETPWVRDLASGNMYLQLSGRWYRGKDTKGPWEFVRGDKLPAAFSDIPPASEIGGVRTSVAGTDEANEAIADAQIPQTAAIQRDQASLDVTYDGPAKFEKIKGTDVEYAVNTGAQVLRIAGLYYAVDDGVWFVASSPSGPWKVADSIPTEQIAEIPPSSPVYNTTYVHIYDSTPEVVYVGYTPGYMWSYPYYGVPYYGTGWYYPPYYGRWYYPRPPTWGFHVGYNPWTGWNFGVSWGGPFLRVGVVWGGGWGHAPYRPGRCCNSWYGGGYRHNDVNININTGDINIGNNVNIGNKRDNLDRQPRDQRRDNIYKNQDNRHRNADPSTARANLKTARSNPDRRNDVFAGQNGQVARRDGDQWQVRNDHQWQNSSREQQASRDISRPTQTIERPTQRDSQQFDRSQHQQLDHQRMNRDFNARQRGNTRARGRR